jgi:hypothetical protein
LERRNANAKKMKGRNIEDQEKYFRRISLNLRRTSPCREKEISISPAMAKKTI